MKKKFTAVIVHNFNTYSHLYVIATDALEARTLVEQHLFERRPLGFSEREIRKSNPKRTPWIPGLSIGYFFPGHPQDGDPPIGVVMD